MTEEYMRLRDAPSVCGPVVEVTNTYISIENETTEIVTRTPEEFEACGAPATPAPQLTERQIKALDWVIQVALEQTAEQAPGLPAEQAVEDICDIASLIKLMPMGEVYSRLAHQCEELRREHQARVDEMPKVSVIFTIGGLDHGEEFVDRAAAGARIAEWIAGLDHDVGTDHRISIEFLGRG